ncbi:tetratricopeptide repeat protein [Methylomagnum sp.]
MIKPRLCLLIPALLIQAACVSVSTDMHRRPIYQPLPEPREPSTRRERRQESPPAQAPEPSRPEDRTAGGAPVTATPAVIALRGDAEASVASGDLDGAAATLERAIRLQSRNPELWHDLAQVRLKQGQPILAEDLAKKSNLHAKGNTALVRANWALIAEARRLKGDDEGAADAAQKAGN